MVRKSKRPKPLNSYERERIAAILYADAENSRRHLREATAHDSIDFWCARVLERERLARRVGGVE